MSRQDVKSIFENVIKRGNYNLTGLLENLDKYHIEGKLTDEERDALYAMARQTPEAQYDVQREIELLWAAIREIREGSNTGTDTTPDEEYPEYVQPTGAHDAYHTGAKVTFKGQRKRCLMDNCVWSPDVLPSAWEDVTEEETNDV